MIDVYNPSVSSPISIRQKCMNNRISNIYPSGKSARVIPNNKHTDYTCIIPKYSEMGDPSNQPPNLFHPMDKNIIEQFDEFTNKTTMLYGTSF